MKNSKLKLFLLNVCGIVISSWLGIHGMEGTKEKNDESTFPIDRIYKDWDFDENVNCIAPGDGPSPVIIQITNLLDNTLEFKGYKLYSGKVMEGRQAPYNIGHTKNDRKVTFLVSGKESTLYGSEGTVAYRIINTDDHIRIYWDCPVGIGAQIYGKFYCSNNDIRADISKITNNGACKIPILAFTVELGFVRQGI